MITKQFKYYLLLVLLSILPICIMAQTTDSWWNTDYNTTEGTEFYATFIKNAGETKDSENLTLYLQAVASRETKVTITYLSDNTTESIMVGKNEQKTVEINISKAYADYDNTTGKKPIEQITKCALYVTSDYPISLYITNSLKNAYSATCVLPTSALGMDYVVQTYLADKSSTEFAVVGTEDNTLVKLALQKTKLDENSLSIDDGVFVDTIIHEELEITLNRGEVFLYLSNMAEVGLSGTAICSDKPIAVFNGNQFARIPYYKDENQTHLSTQTYPTNRWGKKYVVTPTLKNDKEHVRLTAFQDNTILKRDGIVLCTLDAFETYQDTIYAKVNYYESNKSLACFLYTLTSSALTNHIAGRPSMTPITPLEYAANEMLLGTFTHSKNKLLKEHYVNIVSPVNYVSTMLLDGTNISSYFTENFFINNQEFKYAQIPISANAHQLTNSNPKGIFTARVFGMGSNNNGTVGESYAYSAGSRVSRAVDMLLNDQYIKTLKICLNQKVKFTSLINYEYDNIEWEIDGNIISQDSIVNKFQFDEPGIYDVNLHVYSHSPICDYPLEDIVKARIEVVTLSYQNTHQNICFGEEFQVQHKGETITLKADTSTQYWEGKPFKMQINEPWKFTDTIQQSETDECDIVKIQEVTIRPIYDTIIHRYVCDEHVWTQQIGNKIDTIHVFNILHSDKLPVTKEHTHSFKTKYGCDSIVTMKVHLNKTYYFESDSATCQVIGEHFKWEGHSDGRILHIYDENGEYQKVTKIPLYQSGSFRCIDSLQTKAKPHCDSIYVLNLTIHPRYEFYTSDTICQNESYTWSADGKRYIGSTFAPQQPNDILLPKADSLYTFVKTFSTWKYGCDSIHTLNLYIAPTYDTIITHDMCDNDMFTFNDSIFTGKKADPIHGLEANESAPYEYTFPLKTMYGCDSIVKLRLYVHPTSSTEESVVICQSESGIYEWKKDGVAPPYWCPELGMRVNEIRLDQLGTFTYIDSVSTIYECDDIHILHLTVGGYEKYDTIYMCDNDTVVWHNQLYIGAKFNSPYDIGGYSIHELNQSIQPQQINYSIVETSVQGCDSTHYLTLYVYPSYPEAVKIENIELCHDETYEFYGSIYNKNGEWGSKKYETTEHQLTYNEKSIYGCDSSVIHVIYVHPQYRHEKTDTICQNSGCYQWNIPKYLESGDSIVTVVTGKIKDEHGNELLADNIPTNQIGEYTYTQRLQTKNGCDSVAILHLHVNEISEIRDTLHLCDNSFITWNNNAYVGEKCKTVIETTYDKIVANLSGKIPVIEDTIVTTNIYGCKNFHYLTLYVHSTYEITDTVTICDNYGNPYNWEVTDGDGQKHIIPIHFPQPVEEQSRKEIIVIKDSSVMLHSKYGCDSLVNLHLTICPTYTYTSIDTICQARGEFYTWVGHSDMVYSLDLQKKVDKILLDSIGTFTYLDSTKTDLCDACHDLTCDIIHKLQLTVLPSYYILVDQVKISEEEIYQWDVTNIIYGGQKTNLPHDITLYADTTIIEHELNTNPVGSYICDSVLQLEIIIGKVYRDTLYDTICSNQSYTWYGKNDSGGQFVRMQIDKPTSTVYKDSYVTNLGFDSIFYLDLTVHPAYEGIDSMTIHDRTCQHSTYQWIRRDANAYPARVFSIDKQQWVKAEDIPTDSPGVYTYVDSLLTIHGCDSVYTLILQIDSAYNFHDTLKICDNEYAIWENKIYVGSKFFDTLPNATMPVVHVTPQWNYLDTIVYKTKTNCDSTRYLHLDIHPLYNHVVQQFTCDNNIPYLWRTQDCMGEYVDTIMYVPSEMYYVNDLPTKDIISVTDKQRTLTSMHGCDSIVNLQLTIAPTYRFVESATICANDSYEWRGRSFRGHDTVCIDSYSTVLGCDSIYELRLYVNAAPYIFSDIHICTNQSEPVYHTDGRNVIWKPGDPMINDSIHYIYKTEYGCDSTFIYYLYFEQGYDIIDSCTVCSNDTIYMQSSNICTLPVQFYEPGIELPRLDTLICDTLCSEYICKDELNKPTTCCCDSILKMYIHVLPAYKHIDYDTICSNMTYEWRGRSIQYQVAGEYLHYDSLLTKHTQCDSIYELRLYVKQSYNIEYHDTICNDEVYMFYGTQLIETGVYNDTAYTYNGCDSITTLYLTVHDTMVLNIQDTICVTEKYDFFGTYLTERGYYDTITRNEWGCKQYNYLQLEVIDTTSYEIEIGDVICADDEEIRVEYEWLSGRRLIEYSIYFDEYGHSQGFDDIIHASLDINLPYFTIPMPRGEDLPKPDRPYFDSQQGVNKYVDEIKQNYPEPNIYTMRVVMHNGICGDTLQRKDTIVEFLYPSWIHEQHWNDGIVLYNETYNGGHTFSHYQWYQNGEAIIGATKEYLYIPSDLLMNTPGNCENYYQVELTRESDGYKTKTCPICPVQQFDSIVPQKDYLSVVPTMVVSENPQVHILSTKAGQYRVMTMTGEIIIPATKFEPNDNNYAGSFFIPKIRQGWVNVHLVTVDGDGRTIKVLIR